MSRSGCINKIPVTWQSICLSDIFYDPQNDIVSGPFGSNLKTSDYTNDGVPILRIQNIKRNKFVNKNIKYTSQNKADQLDRHNYKKGDIVITKLGDPVGKVCIIPDNMDDGIIIADLVRARLNHSLVSKKFIVYQLNSGRVIQQFKAKTKGTTRPRVSLNQVRELNIILPPLNEQHRIVSKIEELFSKLDYAERELKKAQKQLEKYRQALLKNAFEGKKTTLLERLTKLITKGSSPKWQGINYVDDDNQTLFITSENVQETYIDLKKKKFVENLFNEKQKRTVLKKGDVLLNIVGASIGRSAIFDYDYIANINQAVALIRILPVLNHRYLCYFLNSQIARHYYQARMVDVARANLSLKDVSEIPIPFCPLGEQEQIVQELETKFSLIANLENIIKTNLPQIEGFRYVVLKKAFKGELVLQNPDDEDISKLLQKIQEEKEDYLNVQKEVRKKKPKGRLIMKKDKSIKEILKGVDSSIEAEELWLQSKHEKDIEAFYAELKKIETEINIETKEKKSLIGLKR